jgi:hypothetical protein
MSLNSFNDSSLTGTGFHAPLSFGPGSSGGNCIGGKACPAGFSTDADGGMGGAVCTFLGSYSGEFDEGRCLSPAQPWVSSRATMKIRLGINRHECLSRILSPWLIDAFHHGHAERFQKFNVPCGKVFRCSVFCGQLHGFEHCSAEIDMDITAAGPRGASIR